MLIFLFLLVFLPLSVFYQIDWVENIWVDYAIVGATFSVFFVYLAQKVPKKVFWILLLGYGIRLLVFIIDYYQLAPIMHSGADSEAFDQITLLNVSASEIIRKRTNYTDILYYIYQFSSGRFIAQYVNLIFGFSSIYLLYNSLLICKVNKKVVNRILLVGALLPTHVILSVILLREAWIMYFIALSVYLVLKWCFVSPSIKYVLGALTSVMLASYMHAGVVFLLVGYLLLFTIYNPIKQKTVVTMKSIAFMGIGVLLLSVLFLFKDSFIGKFASIESNDLENAQELVSTRFKGESSYLTWVRPEKPTHLIIFTPLKLFYFIGSPIPLDWRGTKDMIAFMLDGILYLYLFYLFGKNYKRTIYKQLVNALLLGVTISYIAFAWGTSNAGTAMRHRCKLLTVLLVIYGLQTIQKNTRLKKQ